MWRNLTVSSKCDVSNYYKVKFTSVPATDCPVNPHTDRNTKQAHHCHEACGEFFRNFVKAWKSYWMKKGILTVVHTLVSDVTWITLRRHSRMLLALHSYFDGISYDKKFLLRPLFWKKKCTERTRSSRYCHCIWKYNNESKIHSIDSNKIKDTLENYVFPCVIYKSTRLQAAHCSVQMYHTSCRLQRTKLNIDI